MPDCQPDVSRQKYRRQRSIMEPPPPSLIPGEINDHKILEVTQKIIELLTREVPIRCQDVTVYFSMEEWEYLEGHKDIYKNVMTEDQPLLTSPDGSRNTPERCPSPLYSRNSTQEYQEISPVRCTRRPLYSQDSTQNEISPKSCSHKSIQDHCEITSKSFSSLNPQKLTKNHKMPHDSTVLNDNTTYHYQGDKLIVIKVEDEEDLSVEPDEHSKQEEIPSEISTDGHYQTYEPSFINIDGEIEDDDITTNFPIENHHITKFLTAPQSEDLSSDLSAYEVCIIDDVDTIPHSSPRVDKLYPCPHCSKCFTHSSHLFSHQSIHMRTKPYGCSACGKSFGQKSHLLTHLRIHTGEKPYSCPQCGKCFHDKANLFRHGRIHKEDKPYSCHVCGRCFKDKSNLTKHLRIHTGEKPYCCFECGKCFSRNSHLAAHQKSHRGEKPH